MKLADLKPLHDLGLSLLYLHPREKRPIENKWTTTPNKTWEELQVSFQKTYNVGVRLGLPSHIHGKGYLTCLDVDIKDTAYREVALKRLREVQGDVTYAEVRSGSGNGARHLYGVSREPFKQITLGGEKGKWEICAYSTGRQMVLPPSVHPVTGQEYVWRIALSHKTLPVFDPSRFVNKREKGVKTLLVKNSGDAHVRNEFKFEEVNLYDTPLPLKWIRRIEEGVEEGEGSNTVYQLGLVMCRLGFTDNQILSVLSNEDHGISRVGLKRRGNQAGSVAWLKEHTLDKARDETSIMRRFENKPCKTAPLSNDEMEEEEKEVLPDWQGKGGTLRPAPTLRNVVHVLQKFMGGGLIGLDEFSNRVFFLKDTAYGGIKGTEIGDYHDIALRYYLACQYRFEPSQQLCFEAHNFLARENAYHPVRDYLNSLKWDGIKRLDLWLTKGLRAKGPDEYIQTVSRKILTAAVARVFQPGCKFDYVLTLESPQGKKKSSALEVLASAPWFVDGIGDISQKDVVDHMVGKWIIELAELANIKKNEVESTKAFLSRKVDRVRMPWGKRSQDFPRQSIFIGSTNNLEYLVDETGNRRFWPVNIERANIPWLTKNRDQLWAEARVSYERGETLYLSEDLEKMAKQEQEERFDVDEWEPEILKIISKGEPGEAYTGTEIWRAIQDVGSSMAHPPRQDVNRIGKIMRRLGYKKGTEYRDKIKVKCWKKE